MKLAGIIALVVLIAAGVPQELAPTGEFRFQKGGDLSGPELGAARFQAGPKIYDGEPAFIVGLLTGAVEGGLYLVREGTDPPQPGTYDVARAEVGSGGGYDDVELGSGFAVLYFDMHPQNLILLGSTGAGTIEIVKSRDDLVQGRFELFVEGYSGNPRAMFSLRKRRATVTGSFSATSGEVDFRLP